MNKEIVTRLNNADLPIASDKSIEVVQIEEGVILFIGNMISLKDKTVAPRSKSYGKLTAFFEKYDIGNDIPYTLWDSLAGKLVSNSILHRRILGQFNYVYRHRTDSKGVGAPKHEVQSIISLLPLPQVDYNLSHANLIFAFDTSNVTASFVYTYLSNEESIASWKQTIHRKATKDMTPKSDPLLEDIISRYNWKLAVQNHGTSKENCHISAFSKQLRPTWQSTG